MHAQLVNGGLMCTHDVHVHLHQGHIFINHAHT